MNVFFEGNNLQAWLLQLAGGLMLMLSGYRFLSASTNKLLAGWIDKHIQTGAEVDGRRRGGKIGAWLTGTLPAAILSVSRDSFSERLLSGGGSRAGPAGRRGAANAKNTETQIGAGSTLAMNLATWLWLALAALLTLMPDSSLPALATLALGLILRLRYNKPSQNTGLVISSIGLMLLGMSFLIAAMAATPQQVLAWLLHLGKPILFAAAILTSLLGALRGGSITAGTLVLAASSGGLVSPAAAVLLLGCSWFGRSWASNRRSVTFFQNAQVVKSLLIDSAIWAIMPLMVLLAAANTIFNQTAAGANQAFISLMVFLGFVLLEAASLALAEKTKPVKSQKAKNGSQSPRPFAKTRLSLLEYLSADDYSVCRKPERLDGNISILRTLVTGTIGLTVDLLMELLNASQLPDEAKAIRRRVDSGRADTELQCRILDSAMYACTPAASSCGRAEELRSYSASLVQLKRIAADCAAIARSLSKQSKNNAACVLEDCLDLFTQISLILDLLRYVQDLSEGLGSVNTPQILEEMETNIAGMRDTLKKQAIQLIESRSDGSLKVELAFIETNDRLLHIADAGLELYRHLGSGKSS
ncbi:MAG: hypothetical protein KKI09_01375 [Spirochaetes bacterium]|nr:hypothetical protein [Spirochaetota bacterium]MBU0954053.1 hypothetical protein [Spirochaetota bacterium]